MTRADSARRSISPARRAERATELRVRQTLRMAPLSYRVALYTDSGAFPLWYLDDHGHELANAADLALSANLWSELSDWATRCEWADAVDDDARDRQLAAEGAHLKERVRAELGRSFTVR